MPGSKVWYCVNCGYETGHRGRCHSCKTRLEQSPLPPLEVGDEEDEVGYRLDEWEDDERGRLIVVLIRANVRHRFEDDELVVDAGDEEKVDDLLADLRVVLQSEKDGEDHGRSAPLLAEGTGDEEGEEGDEDFESLVALHGAAKKLRKDPTDMQADGDVAQHSAAVFVADEFPGIDEETWAAIGRVTRRLLAALGSEEALEDEIRTQASVLVKLLEPIVDPDAAAVNRLIREGDGKSVSAKGDLSSDKADKADKADKENDADKADKGGESDKDDTQAEKPAKVEKSAETDKGEDDESGAGSQDRDQADEGAEDTGGDESEMDELSRLRQDEKDAEQSGDRRKARQLRREIRRKEKEERKAGKASGRAAGDRRRDESVGDDGAEDSTAVEKLEEDGDDSEDKAVKDKASGAGKADHAEEKAESEDKADKDLADGDKADKERADLKDEAVAVDSGGTNEIVYELPDWLPEQRANLSVMLDDERIRHDWDGGDLVVATANEERVDEIFTKIEEEEGGVDDEARYRSLEELFAAADRLAKDPGDEDRRNEALEATAAADGPTPLGLDDSQWWPIRAKAKALHETLESDASNIRVAEDAGSVRDLLRAVL